MVKKNKTHYDNYNNKFDYYLNQSNIVYHGYFNHNDIKDVYKKTDLLLIPSTYETGSFTCLEAFSYQIPVIARNCYGLKNIIKNSITGYLLNNDDEFIDKIKNINNDPIFNNKQLIYDESLKYNIIDKINDLEIIFDSKISKNNIIIITSVINISNKPLSYYHTRSIFTIEERFNQTKNTIDSIYNKFKNNFDIFFCECSDLNDYPQYETYIKNNVDYYYNFNKIDLIKNYVESEYKGLGECYILKEAINIIIKNNKIYKDIYKLSNRYYLNDDFNINDFNDDFNIFNNWDNNLLSFCSIFYKIRFQDINIFYDALNNMDHDLKEGNSIEYSLFKFFNINIKILNKLNIQGNLSTEGYLISI